MNKTYKEWFELLEQALDDLNASLDNEESVFIQEDRTKLLQLFQTFGSVQAELIPDISLIEDMNNLSNEIIFYLNLASDELKSQINLISF